jgi:sialate O-acetylesterase
MVLQRDISASLYGHSSKPNTLVTVSFDSESITTISDESRATDGGYFWKVDLKPREGGFKSFEITISSSNAADETVTLSNVVFGDVFLCSGQSNMQSAVIDEFGGEEEVEGAGNYSYIRLFAVGNDLSWPQFVRPQEDLHTISLPWAVASSSVLPYFAAVCWEFGRNIFEASLRSAVPVGLVSSCWGGTMIETWTTHSNIQNCKKEHANDDLSKILNSDIFPTLLNRSSTDFDPNKNSALYYAMIYPLKDMKIKAAVWYQGESNYGQPDTYQCLQNGMVEGWRSIWGIDFPFLYTQLSTWQAGGNGVLATFRLMQTKIMSITKGSKYN